MLVVVHVQLHDLQEISEIYTVGRIQDSCTLTLIQSASTFASAQRFVRGGRMAMDPNMIASTS